MYIEIEGSDKIRLALIGGIMDVGQGLNMSNLDRQQIIELKCLALRHIGNH
jgi:hypothetical protein